MIFLCICSRGRLLASGILTGSDEEALFHCTPEVLEQALKGHIDGPALRAEITQAQYEKQAWRNHKAPYWAGAYQKTKTGKRKGKGAQAAGLTLYQGFACSPGREGTVVEGPARVITNLADQVRRMHVFAGNLASRKPVLCDSGAHFVRPHQRSLAHLPLVRLHVLRAPQAPLVQAGEILIAHYTSPAWSPLFSLIQAIVLEEGGMLSHGAVRAHIAMLMTCLSYRPRAQRGDFSSSPFSAVLCVAAVMWQVVARECGIPAVSQLHSACSDIQVGV